MHLTDALMRHALTSWALKGWEGSQAQGQRAMQKEHTQTSRGHKQAARTHPLRPLPQPSSPPNRANKQAARTHFLHTHTPHHPQPSSPPGGSKRHAVRHGCCRHLPATARSQSTTANDRQQPHPLRLGIGHSALSLRVSPGSHCHAQAPLLVSSVRGYGGWDEETQNVICHTQLFALLCFKCNSFHPDSAETEFACTGAWAMIAVLPHPEPYLAAGVGASLGV